MKIIIRYALLLAAFTVSAFSCDKDEDLEVLEEVAAITWSGDYAVDGCGFHVQIGEKRFKPANEASIDNSFKSHDPIPVEVKFVQLGQRDFQCGMLPMATKKEFIRILSIKKI
ncbi:hypothetical protein [uncultured Pontibacter sp.]|uniref:hypothetical protein n=1 Tax=uncultured Pontibacter sp. TaxID=453356 RepID=UPI0026114FC0|nr:hypothetical protein [uncultured Pontibacter sp.]